MKDKKSSNNNTKKIMLYVAIFFLVILFLALFIYFFFFSNQNNPPTAAPDTAPATGTPAPSTGTPAPSTGTPAPSTGTPAPSTGKPLYLAYLVKEDFRKKLIKKIKQIDRKHTIKENTHITFLTIDSIEGDNNDNTSMYDYLKKNYVYKITEKITLTPEKLAFWPIIEKINWLVLELRPNEELNINSLEDKIIKDILKFLKININDCKISEQKKVKYTLLIYTKGKITIKFRRYNDPKLHITTNKYEDKSRGEQIFNQYNHILNHFNQLDKIDIDDKLKFL